MEQKYTTPSGSSSSNDSKRWMLIAAGVASVTIAATGYLLYGY